MKLFLALAFITGSYMSFLFYTTDVVLDQTERLHATYQHVAAHSEEIAAGRPAADIDN